MEGNHKDRNHALLSASGASRWMNCNPSARLEDMFPDCSSEYAEEGTLAHEISELKLTKYLKPMSLRTFNSKMKKLKSHKLYKPEMENYTDVYVDNIKELLMSFDKPGTAEIEKKVDFSEYVPEGFVIVVVFPSANNALEKSLIIGLLPSSISITNFNSIVQYLLHQFYNFIYFSFI